MVFSCLSAGSASSCVKRRLCAATPKSKALSVFDVSDVVRAFIGHKEPECRSHRLADVLKGARAHRAEERLQFGECLFDRIEVGAVRRKKPQERTNLLNRSPNLGVLVDREVVEHDHIAAAQRRHQDWLDVGQEGDGVDGAIEHGRCGQLRRTEGGDHGVCLPVAARRVIRNAGPAQAPRIEPQQIRGHARFIHEDVLAGIVERQRLDPLAARGRDIRSTLFVSVYGLF
jgi:hypothetical protein